MSKLVVVLFSILVLSRSYLAYRKKEETLTVLLAWWVIWLFVIVFSFAPQTVDYLLSLDPGVGIERLLGIVIVFMLYVVYRLYVKTDRLERKLTQLVSSLALKDLDKD